MISAEPTAAQILATVLGGTVICLGIIRFLIFLMLRKNSRRKTSR